MRYGRSTACLLSVILICPLTACAPSQTIPTLNARYYPDCYDPINKLCQDQKSSLEIAKTTGVSGILGIILGAGAGWLVTKDTKGTVWGAIIGLITGASAGFFHAYLSEINDRNERLESYKKLLGKTSKDWGLVRTSIERAYTCYREQISQLTWQVRNRQISREDFLARMAEIEAGLKNINTYWANAQTRIDERIADGHAFLRDQDEKDKRNVRNRYTGMSSDLVMASHDTRLHENAIKSGKATVNILQQATISDMDALKAFADKALVTVA